MYFKTIYEFLFISLFACTLVLPQNVFAKGDENSNLVPTGDGIARPSYSSGVDQNPCGVILNSKNKFHFEALIPKSGGENGYGAHFLFGNSNYMGASIGVRNINKDNYGILGLALKLNSLDTALGVTAKSKFNGDSADAHVGLMIGSSKAVKLAVAAYGVRGGIDGFGGGLGIDVGSGAGISIDAGVDNKGKGLRVKPGLIVSNNQIALSAAFGFDVDKKAHGYNPISSDFSAGLGISATNNIKLEALYQTISNIYAGLSYVF